MTPKQRAVQTVNAAVRRGDLQRGPCEICGRTKHAKNAIQGHHRFGYDDPLNVVWLCARHHLQEHGHPRGVAYPAVLEAVAAGASQSEVARRLGISRQRVHQILYREANGRPYSDRSVSA
jgi:hypothetical protein